MIDHLHKLVAAHKRGESVGITSICSANGFVVGAVLEHALKKNQTVCLESTGQQVNQFGGYSGMHPRQFAKHIRQTSDTLKLREDQIILGGDHLGPDAWRFETADVAMAKAGELIRHCVQAGYQKLHLDPSMPCRDDVFNGHPYLPAKTIADRTAALCEIAEDAYKAISHDEPCLTYVVGTEVPTPGGLYQDKSSITVSSVKDVEETIYQMRSAFTKNGLESAWNRCVAIVVEAGVSFGPEAVLDYDCKKTSELKSFIEGEENFVFEAHSTDFQTRQALTSMVQDHFAILKVGPWLTFATREALYALASIERDWLKGKRGAIQSQLPKVMQDIMKENKMHWQEHYRGNKEHLQYISVYGFSDRIRYYWSHAKCLEAVVQLFYNLDRYGIPLPLLSQYMPTQYESVREGRLQCTPRCLVHDKVIEVLVKYDEACGKHTAK